MDISLNRPSQDSEFQLRHSPFLDDGNNPLHARKPNTDPPSFFEQAVPSDFHLCLILQAFGGCCHTRTKWVGSKVLPSTGEQARGMSLDDNKKPKVRKN
jgi:hypothetical protein